MIAFTTPRFLLISVSNDAPAVIDNFLLIPRYIFVACVSSLYCVSRERFLCFETSILHWLSNDKLARSSRLHLPKSGWCVNLFRGDVFCDTLHWTKTTTHNRLQSYSLTPFNNNYSNIGWLSYRWIQCQRWTPVWLPFEY